MQVYGRQKAAQASAYQWQGRGEGEDLNQQETNPPIHDFPEP
jgi:hypothetical protein